MIAGYQSALSGLQAFGTKLSSTSNNIANANTDGFKRTRVTNSSVEPHGVKANVEKVETAGTSVYKETTQGQELTELSNVDLASELTDMIVSEHMYKANLKTIKTLDELSGSLIDLKS